MAVSSVILYFVIDTVNEKNGKDKLKEGFDGISNEESYEDSEAEENSDTAKGEK